jgi:HD superfamily phosphohydrolase
MTSPLFHVIKDPVHGTMQFTSIEDAWIKPFIDSPHFQRLRHIKQLGLGDLIFPGAVHTRFNHSLGCCYVASQIAHKIGLPPAEQQIVMIASLLHDIGHGPFSHAFEGLFDQKLIRHEDWTPYFLADYDREEFFQYYNKLNPLHPLTDETFQQIAGMIMHKPAANQVLADIVSSQLDADRLDYLLRDSHFCGVKYGEFDFRWLLHCMAIAVTDQGKRLGITHKGIGAVEHYLMARRLMTRNIYHSQKKLALEYFLVEFLSILAQTLDEENIFADFRHTRLGEFLIAVNQFNSNKHIDKKRNFLEKYYHYYKELCDYDVFSLIKSLSCLESHHPAVQIAMRLQKRHMPKIIRLDQNNKEETERALGIFKNQHPEIQDWQLSLITTPHQAYSGEADPLFVVNEDNLVKPLSHFSFMIQAISDKLEHMIFLCIDQAIVHHDQVNAFLNEGLSCPSKS